MSRRPGKFRNGSLPGDPAARRPAQSIRPPGGAALVIRRHYLASWQLMCTLAIYYRSFADYPVVIAANRDEYLARPALPPTLLCADPQIVGGKDLQASGTWLGLNEHGVVAGLLIAAMAKRPTTPTCGRAVCSASTR